MKTDIEADGLTVNSPFLYARPGHIQLCDGCCVIL